MAEDTKGDEGTVRSALAAAGLSPSDDEVAVMVEGYADYRAAIDALYAVPEARHASSALVFNAAPIFVDWAEEAPDRR
jgi:ABC-type nitrate/sulfonate/bicarbonate transport system substrate-binding protein